MTKKHRFHSCVPFWILPVILLVILSGCDLFQDDEEPATYTVTYNGNGSTGGNVPTDGDEYEQGDTVTVSGNTGNLAKTGYTFGGWNTAADGSGTYYAAGDTFTMGDGDVTLYAQWGGKITVTIENAATFSGHWIYYSIYDSNATDPGTGAPTGNTLGQGGLEVVGGAGSTVTIVSVADPTERVFDNGTYYLGGMVDMNDNAAASGYAPDTGDRVGDFIEVVVNGDTTLALAEGDFPIVMP